MIGEPYDPKSDVGEQFDYVWDGTKKAAGTYDQRTQTLTDGFMHYIDVYYFDAEVSMSNIE